MSFLLQTNSIFNLYIYVFILDGVQLQKLKWELVDMGSLNGTLLNSKAIHHANSESRHWGDPAELASGDIITLGTTSKIFVSPFACGLLHYQEHVLFTVPMTLVKLYFSL